MKQKRLKPNRVEIGINPRLNKPAGEIEFCRIDTNLTNQTIKKTGEYISISYTNEELIRLRNALKLYFGY